MKAKKKTGSNDQAMTLVDSYYMPSAIAQAYCLLRDHCLAEVSLDLDRRGLRLVQEKDKQEGRVLVAYDAMDRACLTMELTPQLISRLEKEISAERLEKFLDGFIKVYES